MLAFSVCNPPQRIQPVQLYRFCFVSWTLPKPRTRERCCCCDSVHSRLWLETVAATINVTCSNWKVESVSVYYGLVTLPHLFIVKHWMMQTTMMRFRCGGWNSGLSCCQPSRKAFVFDRFAVIFPNLLVWLSSISFTNFLICKTSFKSLKLS